MRIRRQGAFGTRLANSEGMRHSSLLTLALPLALATGCYVEVYDDGTPGYRTGDLTLRYEFDGRTCIAAGVDRIAVRLEGRDHGEIIRDDLDCARYEDGVTFEGLRADTYDVEIDATDYSGALLYRLEGRRVDVDWNLHQEYDLEVGGMGGALTLYWTFEGWDGCPSVEALYVELIDPDGFVYDDAGYDCGFGGVTYDGLMHGVWQVGLEGVDRYGDVIYRAASRNVVVIRGADSAYTVDLSVQM